MFYHYEFSVSLIDNDLVLFDNCLMSLTVEKVIKKSPAEKAGIKKNDIVRKINDIDMRDFIDDTFVNSLVNPVVEIQRNNELLHLSLVKSEEEDLGIRYRENLYPEEEQCINGCVFCFVDQLPNGMRKSLYLKDDDWRYSVLYGNYITMTNMTDKDFERIATRKVSPLYISVHATDPEVRFEMLRNNRARKINDQLKFLYDNNLTFHSQVVLCPGINDGDILIKTIEDMSKLYPYAKSLSIVPVGLTSYRQSLPQLNPVDKEIAAANIRLIETYSNRFKNELGEAFVYASDEFYAKAGIDYPRYGVGKINAQKANGVGLFSDFLDEFDDAIQEFNCGDKKNVKSIIVTGASAYREIKNAAALVVKKYGNINIEVIKAANQYFGESITVSGLLTGYDIIEAVGKRKTDTVFIPENTLKDGVNVFLDDMTIKDIEKAVKAKVEAIPNDGYEFVKALIGE